MDLSIFHYTVIGFHLSTSDTTGSAIESSKPNPILIDVRERRGETIARIIFGATNTTYRRPPDLDEVFSYYILTRDGEAVVRETFSVIIIIHRVKQKGSCQNGSRGYRWISLSHCKDTLIRIKQFVQNDVAPTLIEV